MRQNTAQREVEALNHRCTYCAASPGTPCRWMTSYRRGRPTKHPHPERMQVAKRALTEARS